MFKLFKYLLFGIIFGILLLKSEVLSWFRIQEMFRFHAFHMYGVIMSAIAVGLISVQLLKRYSKNETTQLLLSPETSWKWSNFLGGILFGIGWAIAGACPGPIYTLIGAGYSGYLVVFGGALVGALTFGALNRNKAASEIQQCGDVPSGRKESHNMLDSQKSFESRDEQALKPT